jgi:hypothetical protein
MSRRSALLAVLLSALAALGAEPSLAPDRADLVKRLVGRFYEQENLAGSSGKILRDVVLVQRIVTSEAESRKASIVVIFCKNPKVSLVFLTDETGRATAFLQRGTDTWIYRESLRIPLKVSLSQSVFGDANLGDILGLNLVEDFTCTSVAEEENSYIFQFKRISTTYPYSGVDVVADQESGDFSAIHYRSYAGGIIRQAALSDYASLNGGHRVPTWTISSLHLNTARSTKISYEDIKPLSIPEAFFQPNANSLSQFLRWAGNYK